MHYYRGMYRLIVLGALLSAAAQSPAPSSSKIALNEIKLPPGFSIELFTADVPNARQMALGDKGTLFVGSRRAGNVYAVVDRDGDHKADRVYTVARGLTSPSGIAFRDGSLYVSEISRILRYDAIESKLESPPEPVVVTDKLPNETSHGWKYLGFGPDGMLYVPVGAPCNICERTDDPRFASITRMKPDGSGFEVYASGIRNTVGFDWHPKTGVLWMTENGRDLMGDTVPGDELLRAPKPGMHFGFPYCHAGDVPDPEFGVEAPVQRVHAAGPQARRPRRGDRDDVLHGRDVPAGVPQPDLHRRARLVEPGGPARLPHHAGEAGRGQGGQLHAVRGRLAARHPLSQGPRTVGDAWGRPADVFVMPDGALLISDDEAGAIYRVTYKR